MARSTGSVSIETDRCKGCGLCIIGCPSELLAFSENCVNKKGYQPVSVKDPSKCTGCGNCSLMCPDSVITVRRTSTTRRVAHV